MPANSIIINYNTGLITKTQTIDDGWKKCDIDEAVSFVCLLQKTIYEIWHQGAYHPSIEDRIDKLLSSFSKLCLTFSDAEPPSVGRP